MTATRIPLDALTSDDLDHLYDRLDRAQRSATHRLAVLGKRREQIRELEAAVARLRAGQCTHTRGTHQHHTAPVAGCPWCTTDTETESTR